MHFRLVLELRRFLGCALELFEFFDVARRQHKVVFRDRGGSLVLGFPLSSMDGVQPAGKRVSNNRHMKRHEEYGAKGADMHLPNTDYSSVYPLG